MVPPSICLYTNQHLLGNIVSVTLAAFSFSGSFCGTHVRLRRHGSPAQLNIFNCTPRHCLTHDQVTSARQLSRLPAVCYNWMTKWNPWSKKALKALHIRTRLQADNFILYYVLFPQYYHLKSETSMKP